MNSGGKSGVVRFESTTGPFFWYKQCQLILYDDQVYDMSRLGHMNVIVFNAVLSLNPVPIATLQHNCKDSVVFPSKYMLDASFKFDPMISPYSVAMFSQSRLRYYDAGFDYYNIADQFTGKILKIQRFMRSWVRARLQARTFALVMSTHARLGQNSLIQMLGMDLLRVVCVC